MAIRVLLADDHALLRDLLRRLLEAEPDIRVIGEAADGRELLRQAQALRPDVAIVDIAMPELNGVDATAQLTTRHPALRVVCLSSYTAPSYVRSMLKAGAAGYLNKSVASSELVRAVRAVAAGQTYLCPEVAGVAAESVRGAGRASGPARGLPALGRREREVLQLVAEGRSTTAIAEKLSVSPATVDAHRRNIMRKLDVHTAVELTRLAIREGLVEP